MKLKRRLFFPLRLKFIVLFFLLISVPFMISGTLTYQKYTSDTEVQALDYAAQIASQTGITLDRYVREIERLSLTPLYSPDILTILERFNDPSRRGGFVTTEEQQRMNLFISSLSFDRSEIEGILIFANDGSLFSNLDASVTTSWTEQTNPWVAEVRAAKGSLVVVPPHEAAYYRLTRNTVLSLARELRDPIANHSLGMIKIDLKSEGFERIFAATGMATNTKLVVKDKKERVLYPFPNARQDSDFAAPDPREYLLRIAEPPYSELLVQVHVPLGPLQRNAQQFLSYTFIISIVSLVFAYVLAILSSNRLVKPIRHLQSKMKLVQKGSFHEVVQVRTHDEIGQLGEVFNKMVQDLNRLVKEVYEARLREKEAELSALQSQINPHFLYNTLETVNMLAIRNNQYEMSDVVTSLGQLLRYTVSAHHRPVTLQDELHFIESYLQIQRYRLGDMLTVEIRVDPVYASCPVPKLILQPIVENVIEHAIGGEPVTLSIYAYSEDDDFIIAVQDSGVGLEPDAKRKIERLLNGTLAADTERDKFGQIRKGVALRNVHNRLKLLYGSGYGLAYQSAQEGTTFLIRIPFTIEEE